MKVESEKVECLYEDLGEKERLFVRQGVVPPRKTRSDMIQSVADSAVNRGWTREEFHEVMLRRSNKGTAKIFEILDLRGAEAARAYLDRSWDKASLFVQRNPPVSNREQVRQQIRFMRSAVSRFPWSALTGPIDLAVLSVHLDIAEKLGSLRYAASLRRIAEVAGVNRDTVGRSHGRLARFLARLPRKGSLTTRWKLKSAVTQDSINLSSKCENYCPDQRIQPDHDIWHQRALGKGCWRTWTTLGVNDGITISDLARQLSTKPRTITERLKRLQRSGMASCSRRCWYRIERDLDAVAAELGTLGKLEARKRQHKAERERYECHRHDQERTRPDSNVTLISEATGKRMKLQKGEQPILKGEPDMLVAALSYARMGFRVLPLQSIRDGQCTCGKFCRTPGKHPVGALVPRGLNNATSEIEVIRKWWARFPSANVGIATGLFGNGLYLNVIDVDPRNGGNDAFVSLIAEGGLPETGTSRTGGGGNHWLLTSTKPLRNSGVLGKGIDFKGEGGCIVAPPSLHHSGQRYEWIRPPDKLAPMPAWLLAKIRRKQRSASQTEPKEKGRECSAQACGEKI